MNFLGKKDLSRVSPKFLKKASAYTGLVALAVFLIFFLQIYIPVNANSNETVTYTVKKGMGDEEIADELKELGLIRSSGFFKIYNVLSLRHTMLQAGKYNLSPAMSSHQIIKKMAKGDIIKNKLIILEGWNLNDIAGYLELKEICLSDYFFDLVRKDYSQNFDFLASKPADVSLEGFLFPDTYEVSEGESCETILSMMLSNFGKKVTPDLRQEMEKDGKSIFSIITMASILEKEVNILEEKKLVSGILWKRLQADMPLQIDATVNYVTGKSDPSVLIRDTKIDSPYNTYKYKGLPKGPISNPGMASILAAINPIANKYWFYLSNGRTIFSETFEQHLAAKAKYLR